MHRGAVIPVVQEISAVTCGLRIHSVNVWERSLYMHLKAKRAAFGGLLLAMTVIFMFLGSVIETNTLFLLAAASFFVGVVFREFGQMTGLAFYLSAVLLGFLLAPNKLYVITFAGMGFYIWGREFIWKILERSAGVKRKMQWYRLAK